jgi:hypothetical protein
MINFSHVLKDAKKIKRRRGWGIGRKMKNR